MSNGNEPIHLDQGGSQRGLTKREYFAGLAMQAQMRNLSDTFIHANLSVLESEFATVTSKCAEFAVAYADALLAELEKTNGNR